LTLPNVLAHSDAESGAGDLAIGVKQQVLRGVNGFDVSVVVSLSLPTGSDAISSHGYDPSLQVPWSAAADDWLIGAGYSFRIRRGR
jgi:hypothetical protein